MNTKILFIFTIPMVVITGVALFFWYGGGESSSIDDSSGLLINHSAIYVAEQAVGDRVFVSVVRLEKSGFVVIHEDVTDAPGIILGISSLIPAGEMKNLPSIMLSRAIVDGELIYAMLHFDNGDGIFDVRNDKPVLDSVDGAPMMMIVTVSKNASESGIVNPL